MPLIAKNIIVVGANTPTTINEEKQEPKKPLLNNRLNVKNIIVLGENAPEPISKETQEPKKAVLSNRINAKNINVLNAPITIITETPEPKKQLPKYVAKEDGELLTKINTKSQYMRDIFDLDS